MLAFNNDQTQADRLREQVLAHEAADEIIQGKYWESGKGCFIGCIAHSDDALTAASLLGGDLMLVRIAESIFEGLPNADAKTFPARVLLAPRVGADLSFVPWQFLHWLVIDALTLADEATRAACQPAVDVLTAKAAGSDAAYAAADAAYAAACSARAAAYAAADAAYAAAYAAADAAYAADAARAAAYAAADAAACSARAAAYAAADAARAAAYAAADAAYAAADAAADAAYAAACSARAAAYAAADAAACSARAAAYAAAYATAYAARAAADGAADGARAAARIMQADKLVELLAAA